MGDYISRKYLVEHLTACFQNGRPMHTPGLNEVLDMVADVPAAAVSQAMPGKWWHYEGQYSCERCGTEVDDPSLYCPGCGAKMDGGADSGN